MKIVFACGNAFESWNPAIAYERGVGGSELAVVEMARRLASLGHEVVVFTNCGEPGLYDGAQWRPTHELLHPAEPIVCDVLVLWRNAGLVDCSVEARARVLWVHDVLPAHLTMERLGRIDRVIALTAWHRAVLVAKARIPPEKIAIGGAGIDVHAWERACSGAIRRPQAAIYTSCPDRGLAELLSLWPLIRMAEPEATLDVTYGFDNSIAQARAVGDADRLAWLEALGAIARARDGVRLHGRLARPEYEQLVAGAGVWLYPTSYDETACAAAMEAQACGLAIAASARAALRETVGPRGVLLDGDPTSGMYQTNFVAAAVAAMRLENPGARHHAIAYAHRHFDWSAIVLRWRALFEELLGCAPGLASPSASSPSERRPRGGAGDCPPVEADPGASTAEPDVRVECDEREGPAGVHWVLEAQEQLVRCPRSMVPHVAEVLEGAYDVPGLEFDAPPRILDIGACVGDFALWARHRWAGAEVHAYEPNPEALRFARENLAGTGVELVPMAVWRAAGPERLFHGPHNLGEASFFDDGGSRSATVEVSCTTPDTLPLCDVLKIDTEGCEVFILEGYLATHDPPPGAVVLEFHAEEDRVRIDALLRARGYALVRGRIHHAAMGVLGYVRGAP